eukprot:1160316-Pelagomonas_calceolata.AAC.1
MSATDLGPITYRLAYIVLSSTGHPRRLIPLYHPEPCSSKAPFRLFFLALSSLFLLAKERKQDRWNFGQAGFKGLKKEKRA